MSISQTKPWNWPWYRWSEGSFVVFFYILSLHVIAIAGLILLPVPPLRVVLSAMTLALLGGLGTTVGYHRALTHRGVELHPWVEQVLIFLSIFNGNTPPRVWVATHRVHHANTDTPADVSSPHHGGFWWAHLRWLWQAPYSPFDKYCPDLNKFKYRAWDKAYLYVIAFSFFFGLIWGWGAWIWLGPLRLLIALHGQCAVNSVCHLGDSNGKAAAVGSSRNIWWLTPLFLGVGENWHENHHRDQTNPRLGLSAWELDLGWWTICALRGLGLARRIGPVSRAKVSD